MRDLKFRIFTGGKVVPITKIEFDKHGFKAYADEYLFTRSSEFLMQYTGLKDKNGKEIYEGDIVRHPYQSKAIVVWMGEYGCYATQTIDEVVKDEYMYDPYNILEVIGNIYENSELLEDKK